MAESDLQRAVCDLLWQHGIPYAENASSLSGTARKRGVKPGLRVPKINSAGPDLIVAPGGLLVFRARSVMGAYATIQEARESGLSVFGLELKSTHRDECKCRNCSAQRAWAEAMRPR
jgi:hypothetical protein